MVTVWFVFLWVMALALALAIGLATHYANAFLRPYPDKLIEGYRWRDHALNEALNSNYTWWGHYDEDGWWEFYSLRNYAAHAAAPVAAVLIGGVYLWSDRPAAIASACRGFWHLGIVPVFCG